MSRLYIIGNGFDLLHKLPTKFDPDFKNIAEKNQKKHLDSVQKIKIKKREA